MAICCGPHVSLDFMVGGLLACYFVTLEGNRNLLLVGTLHGSFLIFEGCIIKFLVLSIRKTLGYSRLDGISTAKSLRVFRLFVPVVSSSISSLWIAHKLLSLSGPGLPELSLSSWGTSQSPLGSGRTILECGKEAICCLIAGNLERQMLCSVPNNNCLRNWMSGIDIENSWIARSNFKLWIRPIPSCGNCCR